MNFIEELYYGNINPNEKRYDKTLRTFCDSVNPDFNPDVECLKDPLSRDIPSVDNSLFMLAKKLLLNP